MVGTMNKNNLQKSTYYKAIKFMWSFGITKWSWVKKKLQIRSLKKIIRISVDY